MCIRDRAKGVWAWGDEVSSQDPSQLAGGDMPHGWTAAEYVDLVRDMLLYETGNSLQIAAGVPASWLPDGGHIAITKLPSTFGRVSYQIRHTEGALTLDLQAATPPPGGYDLHLPFQLAQASIDGSVFASLSSQPLHLPSGAKHVELRLAGG